MAKTNKLTGENIHAFLADPSDRWQRAFSKLSKSEQTLLIALLDLGGRSTPEKLRTVYEDRLGNAHNSLGFTACVDRLTHSFLKVEQLWDESKLVDFQHPSLRDLLLVHLAENKGERWRYIAAASSTALATLIQGTANLSLDPENPERFALVQSDEEMDQLLDRLDAVFSQPLEVPEWTALLRATELLLPRKPAESPLGLAVEWLAKRGVSTTRLTPPDQMDLLEFTRTKEGRIVTAVVTKFSKRDTYDANTLYRLSEWISLFGIWWRLSRYVVPCQVLAYGYEALQDLRNLGGETAAIIVGTLFRGDRVLFEQLVGQRLVEKWQQDLRDTASVLCVEGTEIRDEGLEEWDYEGIGALYERWAGWTSSVRDLLRQARDFSDWAPLDEPSSFEELESLLEEIEIEDPRDYEDHEEPLVGSLARADYWDVDRIMSDL